MADQLLQLVVAEKDADDVCDCLKDVPARDWWRLADESSDRVMIFVALHGVDVQEVLDAISDRLDGRDDWRLVSVATEAALPNIDDEEEVERRARKETAASREEIYADMRQGTALTVDFLVMTALATCVAAIGLSTNQVAVVIGAMVIAPLLGPILAFSFATTLGNFDLLRVAVRTMAAGFGVAIVVGVGLGFILDAPPDSTMLDYSGVLSLRTLALPLASGAAAAVMIAGGNTSALVGVMVAAALLPPLAAMGLLVGQGNLFSAARAMATVITNVVAINLAGQAVFMLKGIRPRRWESNDHQTSVRLSLGVSAGLVVLVGLGLFAAGHGWFGIGE